jgi:hypothetical protein
MKAQDAKIMEIGCRMGLGALYGLKESGQLIHAQASCLFVDLRQAVAKCMTVLFQSHMILACYKKGSFSRLYDD